MKKIPTSGNVIMGARFVAGSPADVDEALKKLKKGETGTIKLSIDEPDPENPGKIRFKMRTCQDVFKDLCKALETHDMMPDESFSDMTRFRRWKGEEVRFPDRFRWIACFAVTGSSEGWYIHVEVMPDGKDDKGMGQSQLLYLGKTFQGMDRAYEIAAFCAKVLDA